MNAPFHRHNHFALVAAIILAANPATWAINPPGSTLSRSCNECGQCSTCGTSLGNTATASLASFDWEIQVGLARYSKPSTYTDLAQAAYEKDGNLPTFNEMLGRYFPSSPLQQSQIPLKISQTKISATTFHPSCLSLESEANIPEILKKSDSGGEYIHQILTDDGFTLINILPFTEGSGFRVRVWKRNAAPLNDKDVDGFYITAGPGNIELVTPLTDVIFKRETPNDDNTLLYIQSETTGSGTRTITNKIVQTLGTNGKPLNVTSEVFDGAVATGTALAKEILGYSGYGARAWDYTITRQVLTSTVTPSRTISDPPVPPTIGSPVVTSESVEIYRDFSNPAITNGGELGMKRLMSISQSGQLTTYAYIEDDTADTIRYGRLASVTRPDGSWIAYTYVSMGSSPFITEYSSWGEEARLSNGVTNTNARMTETGVSGSTFTVKTFVAGQLVAKSETTLSTLAVQGEPSLTLVTSRQWDGSGTETDPALIDSNSLTTTTAYHLDSATAPDTGRIKWIEHSDGTATKYTYGPPPEDSLSIAVFAATTRTGAGNRSGVSAGTETVTTYSLGNIPIAESQTDIATSIAIESWVTEPVTFDPIGRPITRVFNGDENDFDTSIYSCCGLEEFRARDGSTTHYYRDRLKRVHTTTTVADDATTCPVIATLTFISGLTTTQERVVENSNLFLGSTTRSMDGLITTTISPSRKSSNSAHRLITRTATAYPFSRAVTTESYNTGNNPDILTGWIPTSVTTHYLDGRPNTVSGIAVTDVSYEYGTHTHNGGGLVTSATVAGMTTPSATYTDALGRTVKTVSPANGSTTYTYHPTDADPGNRGKLASVTDDDDVTTTFVYNVKGERTTTARSVPILNGQQEPDTATQTTITTSAVVADEDLGPCQCTVTTVNGVFVSQSLTVIDISNGFISVVRSPTGDEDAPTAHTTTVTTRPASGDVTTTTTHTDGTRTISTITHGVTKKVEQKTAGSSSSLIASTEYDHDTLQRLLTVRDSRTGITTYGAVNATVADVTESGQPLTVTNPHSNVTSYVYDVMGRGIQTTLGTNETNTSYYPTGQIKAQWGNQIYPTFRVYNELGQLAVLHTWQTAPGLSQTTDVDLIPSGSATTTWMYDVATGLVISKLDDTGKGPAYTYTDAGRLKTRIWARGLVTGYGYAHGYLTTINYYGSQPLWQAYLSARATWQNLMDDVPRDEGAIAAAKITMDAAYSTNATTIDTSTSPLAYFYDSLGRLSTVKRGGNNHATYTYRTGDFQPATETQQIESLNRTLTRTFETSTGGIAGRINGYTFPGGSAMWTYDSAGRRSSVTDSTDTFTYGYRYEFIAATINPDVPAHHLGATGTGAVDSFIPFTLEGPKVDVTLAYEATRDVLYSRKNVIGISPNTSTVSKFTYTVNELGQRRTVSTSGGEFDTNPADWTWYYNDGLGQITSATASMAANNRAYTYDTIGNRLTAVANTSTTYYWGNDDANDAGGNTLNQYVKTNFPSGLLASIYDWDGNMESGPVTGPDGLDAGMPAPSQASLAWDGENRLIQATVGQTTVSYVYDHLSRLIRRDDGTTVTQYFHDGWNRIAEFSVTTNTANPPVTAYTLTKTYLWGLDLSATPQGAGGVGGLLSILDSLSTIRYYPTYDGNGNVSEYINSNLGTQSAHFEYDPFGNLTADTEENAADFLYRFSTKPQDPVTGLYYYGYRWYDPLTGRWPSRDPIEEEGGYNLYGFVGNDGVDRWDHLGLVISAKDINSKDSCSKFCETCDSDGTLRIKDNGTSGENVKAIAYGRTLTSRYIKGAEKCKDDCCASSWFWWDCYGRECREKEGAEFNETIKPKQPPDKGPSEGGLRGLSLYVKKQKVCRCEKGTWKCYTSDTDTNRIMYEFVDPQDASKGWKLSPGQRY